MLHSANRVAIVALLFLSSAAGHAEMIAVQARVQGQVINAVTGQVIPGAQVTAGRQVATTDARGRFDVNADAAAGQVVRATRSGFVQGMARIDVGEGAKARPVLRMVPVSSTAVWNAVKPVAILVAGSSAQVLLPGASLMDHASKQAASGTVTALVTAIDPRVSPSAMPGSYLQSTGGSTQAIESFGIIHVEARDSASGQARELMPGALAIIHIPAGPSSAAQPSTAALSRLDESSGLWIQEGSANLRGYGASRYYEGAVTRLGFWSATRLVETIQVHGSVCLPEGADEISVRTDDVDHTMANEVPALPNGGFHVAMRVGGQATLLAHSQAHSSDPVTVGPSAIDIELTDCLPLH